MFYDYMVRLCASQANLNSDNIRLMSAMLCAALYPNVVQVGIASPANSPPAPLGFTPTFWVSGPSSSGELQDDEQRSDEDAPQSQQPPLPDQERRLRARAPVLRQLHGETSHTGHFSVPGSKAGEARDPSARRRFATSTARTWFTTRR